MRAQLKKMVVMDVEVTIENAWLKTIEDFKNANRSGEAWLWTEATLRLNFLRYLCETAKLGRVIAETPYHIGEINQKPDIVVDIMINNNPQTVAFEMKFFRKVESWKKDLKKLRSYGLVGWDYGYFLAIGRPEQCEEILKEPLEVHADYNPDYKVKVLVHPTQPITIATHSKFAEFVLKKALGKNVPYVINELYGAVAWYEKYLLYFDMTAKENKLAVWAELADKRSEGQKTSERGYLWISFDEEGKMHPSEAFTGQILIGEFEITKVYETVKNVREALTQFWRAC